MANEAKPLLPHRWCYCFGIAAEWGCFILLSGRAFGISGKILGFRDKYFLFRLCLLHRRIAWNLPFDAFAWDRSVHETDRILAELYQGAVKAFGENFNFLHTPDHGEDIAHGGHTLLRGKEQFLVPLIVNSEQMRQDAEPESGYFSTVFVSDLIAKAFGDKVDFLRLSARVKADKVWHVDNKIYPFLKVPEWLL